MIPCTDFISAYSELFKFLRKRGGEQAVSDFWCSLSDTFLTNLRDLVRERGIRGCWDYWSHTLNEEAADFTMELDEDNGEFKIIMEHCPSKGKLLALEHVEPYDDYCGHCDVLYRGVLDPLGYDCSFDLSECDRAKCAFTVKRRQGD